MGAYLMYKVHNKEEINPASDWLYEECGINQELKKYCAEISIAGDEDIRLARESGDEWSVSYFMDKYGRGEIKTSGGNDDAEEAGLSDILLLELQTRVFEEVNSKFEMRYFAGSCSLSPDLAHFSLDQMDRITKGGELLSGKSRAPDKFQALKEILSKKPTSREEAIEYIEGDAHDIAISVGSAYSFNELWKKNDEATSVRDFLLPKTLEALDMRIESLCDYTGVERSEVETIFDDSLRECLPENLLSSLNENEIVSEIKKQNKEQRDASSSQKVGKQKALSAH